MNSWSLNLRIRFTHPYRQHCMILFMPMGRASAAKFNSWSADQQSLCYPATRNDPKMSVAWSHKGIFLAHLTCPSQVRRDSALCSGPLSGAQTEEATTISDAAGCYRRKIRQGSGKSLFFWQSHALLQKWITGLSIPTQWPKLIIWPHQ